MVVAAMAPIEPVDDEDPTSVHANPVVKALVPLDDAYLDLERAYQKKMVEIQGEFEAQQRKLLDDRQEILENAKGASQTYGTPAIPNFWLTCLQNHPDLADIISEHDEEVLGYLKNITKEDLPDESGLNMAGFRLIFHFSPNPFFENERLVKEYHIKETNPWTQDLEVPEITFVGEIQWKEGKDVTMEVRKKKNKKKKGKGKKGGSGSTVMEKVPRVSFFRIFFRTLKKGEDAPEDLVAFQREGEEGDSDDDSDEEEDMMEMLMDDDYDKGVAFRDSIIPFAVRWFTGEAVPDDDEDDTDDDDDEHGDDDDDSDDDSDSPPKNDDDDKGGRKNLFAAPAGGANAEAEPECKQQ